MPISSGSGEPSRQGSSSAERTEGIDEEHGFRNRLSTASFAENAGHYRWFIRLTIRDMRTNIEHGGLRINSLKSPSLRDTPGTLMPARTSP